VDFGERWSRFDEAIGTLRQHRPGRPIWVASWGSRTGLRRVARLGDGWLASGFNTSPDRVSRGLVTLHEELTRLGRYDEHLPCTVATMWTHITDTRDERDATLDLLADILGRPRDALEDRVLVGSPEQCALIARAYAEAGVDLLCLWPVTRPERQLERFMHDVAPRV
jgi:alkanesulfonate monooxygenase SsuD/methylene tetrahydromethanopterin reductase-like flavin-dependent oxidoreductase (luciferase family)